MKTTPKTKALPKISDFAAEIIKVLRKIPPGKVVSFGQVALIAGKATSSRYVGWVLKTYSGSLDLPWHRVVNHKGNIFYAVGSSTYNRQKKLLKAEGVEFASAHGVNLASHQWGGPKSGKLAKKPKMFSNL